jgi:hypothetical protein
MARSITASDRKSLIRLASTLPKGSPERKAILASLAGVERGRPALAGVLKKDIDKIDGADSADELKDAVTDFVFHVSEYLGDFDHDPDDSSDVSQVARALHFLGIDIDKALRSSELFRL